MKVCTEVPKTQHIKTRFVAHQSFLLVSDAQQLPASASSVYVISLVSPS